MFWQESKLATCCNERSYLQCGFCPDLPRTELQQAFDNPEHGDNGERLANFFSEAILIKRLHDC
jgi:hypothetical protein